jgi:hypothetical protein
MLVRKRGLKIAEYALLLLLWLFFLFFFQVFENIRFGKKVLKRSVGRSAQKKPNDPSFTVAHKLLHRYLFIYLFTWLSRFRFQSVPNDLGRWTMRFRQPRRRTGKKKINPAHRRRVCDVIIFHIATRSHILTLCPLVNPRYRPFWIGSVVFLLRRKWGVHRDARWMVQP